MPLKLIMAVFRLDSILVCQVFLDSLHNHGYQNCEVYLCFGILTILPLLDYLPKIGVHAHPVRDTGGNVYGP